MANLKQYEEDWLLFAEAGFIAVNQADEDSAEKLFQAAKSLAGDNTLPDVGFGYIHFHKLELKEAIEIFDQVLKKEPENQMAGAFKGICLTMTPKGVTDGEQILEKGAKSDDPLIKNLADSALDFVHRFVKKQPGPAGQ